MQWSDGGTSSYYFTEIGNEKNGPYCKYKNIYFFLTLCTLVRVSYNCVLSSSPVPAQEAGGLLGLGSNIGTAADKSGKTEPYCLATSIEPEP